MIEEKKITVFNSNCDAIVNTVNCRGVMGAGLALEFKLRYPDMFEQYVKDCSNGSVKIGELKTYDAENVLIVNFPTKDHWREPSELWYIEKGLDYLVKHYKEWGIKSIAMPPLGCSNGHLDYNIVRKMIITKLNDVDLDIMLCIDDKEPQGKEKEMVDLFHSCDLRFVCDYLEIKPKQKQTLLDNCNKIKRFYEIFALQGVGEETYKKLHRVFYKEYDDVVKTENRMIDMFNNSDITMISNKISGPQMKLLKAARGSIDRFVDISSIDGVTESTYKKLFNDIRDACKSGDVKHTQMTII